MWAFVAGADDEGEWPIHCRKGEKNEGEDHTNLADFSFLRWCVGIGVVVVGSMGMPDGGHLRMEKRGGRGKGRMPMASKLRRRRKTGGERSRGVLVAWRGGEEES